MKNEKEKPLFFEDLERRRRVFINLITNTIAAMSKEGVLTISKVPNWFVRRLISHTEDGMKKRILGTSGNPFRPRRRKE